MAPDKDGRIGSQFFITTNSTPYLNSTHNVFGRVVNGQDLVDRISDIDLENVAINDMGNSVTIKNSGVYKFKKPKKIERVTDLSFVPKFVKERRDK